MSILRIYGPIQSGKSTAVVAGLHTLQSYRKGLYLGRNLMSAEFLCKARSVPAEVGSHRSKLNLGAYSSIAVDDAENLPASALARLEAWAYSHPSHVLWLAFNVGERG